MKESAPLVCSVRPPASQGEEYCRLEPVMDSQHKSNMPLQRAEGEYVLSLGDFLRVVRGRIWFIATIVLLSLMVASLLVFLQPPAYEASTRILIGQEEGSSTSGNLGGDVQGLQDLTLTMVEAVGSRPLAEEVIERLGLDVTPDDFLEKNLSVEQVSETQFIEVGYTSSDPEEARRAANAVGEEFSKRVSEASPSANAVTATVWEPAVTPQNPVSPDPALYGFGALILGLLLGVGLAFVLEYLDRSWRSPEEVEQVSGVRTLGIIPEFELQKPRKALK